MTNQSKWAISALAIAVAGSLTWMYWRPRPPEIQIRDQRCIGCHVVLISADSVRADHLQIYGYERKTTPVLAGLSGRATVFNNYFSTSYLTPISEASVHTGLYPEVNGMISFRHQISADVKTMAGHFKAAGYKTVAIGTSPEFNSFEAVKKSFIRDFDLYAIPPSRLESRRTPDWKVAREALENSSEPVFLWIALGDAHAPFGAFAEDVFADKDYNGPFADLKFFTNMQFYYDGMFYNPLDPDKAFEILVWGGESKQLHFADEDAVRPRKWPVRAQAADLEYIKAMYDNGIREADREVGRLLSLLSRLQIDDRTVVVFQSEHGEDLGEHKYVAHYDIHDTQVHVPLVIASPARPSAVRTDILVSGVDILPSLMDHVGLVVPSDLDGKSFFKPSGNLTDGREEVYLTRTPLWESIIKAKGDNAIFDRFRALDDKIHFKDHGIRTRSEKLIHRTARLAEEQFSCWTFVSGKKISRSEYEYFDLIKDPGELNILPATSPKAIELKHKLSEWKRQISKRARKTEQSPAVQDYL